RRGGGQRPVPLDEAYLVSDQEVDDILALDEALKQLKTLNERQHQIVECRFFAGMTVEETAALLGVSEATVKRDWSLSREAPIPLLGVSEATVKRDWSLSRAWLNRALARDMLN